MKNISIIIFLLTLFFSSDAVYTIEIDIRKDLLSLEQKDQDYFLEKCEKKKEIIDNPECLNFLGIKLFLFGYHHQNISASKLESLYKKSINYLEIASQKGSKQAFKNLGWIFSNNKVSFFDLEKSSLYFINSYKDNIIIKKNLDINAEKRETIKTVNYSDIILAITLMKKVEIFFEATKDKKKKYFTNDQYNSAKNSFKSIISKKEIKKEKLEELEKKVLENNLLIFTFLREDLKNFNQENFSQANQTAEKLKFLLKD